MQEMIKEKKNPSKVDGVRLQSLHSEIQMELPDVGKWAVEWTKRFLIEMYVLHSDNQENVDDSHFVSL